MITHVLCESLFYLNTLAYCFLFIFHITFWLIANVSFYEQLLRLLAFIASIVLENAAFEPNKPDVMTPGNTTRWMISYYLY